MTYCLGWKTDKTIILAADTALTSDSDMLGFKIQETSFEEPHLQLADGKTVEERALKIFKFNNSVLTYTGSSKLAHAVVNTLRDEINKGTSPREAFAIALSVNLSKPYEIKLIFGFFENSNHVLITFNALNDGEVVEQEGLVQLGSVPEKFKEITDDYLKKSIEVDNTAEVKTVKVLGVLQSYGVHHPLMQNGIGGAFVAIYLDEGGVPHWQPDIAIKIDYVDPLKRKLITACVRNDFLILISPKLGIKKCLGNIDSGKLRDRINQVRYKNAIQQGDLQHQRGKFDFVFNINGDFPIIVLLQMKKKLKHRLLWIKPVSNAMGNGLEFKSHKLLAQYRDTPMLDKIGNPIPTVYYIPYEVPGDDNLGGGKKLEMKSIHDGRVQFSVRGKNKSIQLPYVHDMSGLKFDRSGNSLSLYERNMHLLAGVADIFQLNSKKDWKEIKRTISRDHVKELYKLMAYLWPPDTNIESLLPKPENKLRSLYLGNMRPETVLNSVARYSLYCDQILVINPFLNPWGIAKNYNPLVNPQDYIADTIKWVLFIAQLAPWIKNQHVVLVPDPGDFDYQLRKETWSLAEKRFKDSVVDRENDELMEYLELDGKRMLMSTPSHVMREKFKNEYPDSSDKDLDEMMAYLEKMKEADPYFPTNPKENGVFGLNVSKTGLNLEMGTFLAQMTGSYLYTDFNSRWKEIMTTANTGGEQQVLWSNITHAFQKTDFKFFDKVSPQFVEHMRQDGRLESMRNFLRKTWLSLPTVSDSQDPINNDRVLSFKDELSQEYQRAEGEWKKIDIDLAKWALSSGGVAGILAGGMNWQIPALGFSITAIGKLLGTRYERSRFRSKVPLSVFVDLKNKRR